MDRNLSRGEQNLLLLESVIPGSERLYIWCYDDSGKQIASSCPEEEAALLSLWKFGRWSVVKRASFTTWYAAHTGWRSDGDHPIANSPR